MLHTECSSDRFQRSRSDEVISFSDSKTLVPAPIDCKPKFPRHLTKTMLNFMTVTVPTTINAASMHSVHSSKKNKEPRQHSRRGYQLFKTKQVAPVFNEQTQSAVTASPKPLRKQAEPLFRITLGNVSEILNSPFHYEMTEAARLVL